MRHRRPRGRAGAAWYALKWRNSTVPGPCSLIGGGCAVPDRAAFYNSTLVRYLDFNDSYLAAKVKPVTRATTSGRCSPRRNTRAPSGRDFLARARAGLPGTVPAERRGPGARRGVRPRHPGRIPAAAGLRSGARPRCPPAPPTPSRSLGTALQRAPRHPHRTAVALEGTGLSQRRPALPRGRRCSPAAASPAPSRYSRVRKASWMPWPPPCPGTGRSRTWSGLPTHPGEVQRRDPLAKRLEAVLEAPCARTNLGGRCRGGGSGSLRCGLSHHRRW